MNSPLVISSFLGITPSSLGHYFMGIGLLRAAASRWPQARGFWREGIFYLAGDFLADELVDYLFQGWQPTPYRQWWSPAQKADRGKPSSALLIERSRKSVEEVRVGDTTIIGLNRSLFNPLFGTGGNIGKRNLAKAWTEAERLCKEPHAKKWLEAALRGDQVQDVPPFTNAGTWFVYNNKVFNSGLGWSREGTLSPWAFLLAMDGALLLRGSSGRRLGSRARPYAVFPFVSQPLQPEAREEVGQARGEFWAPLWEQPATLEELRALLSRGLTRLGGRAASAPHEFAVAALARGTDAGVSAFARFELRQTTSSQVYEAIPRETYSINAPDAPFLESDRPATLLQQILGPRWLDRLPPEPFTRRSKTRFSGLRGPIERGVLAVSAAPADSARWRELLSQLAVTQRRVDRNLALRKACAAVPLLSGGWIRRAFPDVELSSELRRVVRLAGAFAALGAGAVERAGSELVAYPAAANVFGITLAPFGPTFVQPGRPQRAVWHEGDPIAALLEFVGRRLMDSNKKLFNLRAPIALRALDVEDFLNPDTVNNFADVTRWLPPLSLINWRDAALPAPEPSETIRRPPSVRLLRWAFFKPFFQPTDLLFSTGQPFFQQGQEPRPGVARQLFSLLRFGALAEAISLAVAGYHAQGHVVICPPASDSYDEDAQRLAAALALPISPKSLGRLVERWIEPAKFTQDSKS